MKPISSSTSGLELNTDRIAAASKQRQTRATAAAEGQDASSAFQAAAFRREMPMTRDAGFVEVDGKKYFLNAPRGTYVNIIV